MNPRTQPPAIPARLAALLERRAAAPIPDTTTGTRQQHHTRGSGAYTGPRRAAR